VWVYGSGNMAGNVEAGSKRTSLRDYPQLQLPSGLLRVEILERKKNERRRLTFTSPDPYRH